MQRGPSRSRPSSTERRLGGQRRSRGPPCSALIFPVLRKKFSDLSNREFASKPLNFPSLSAGNWAADWFASDCVLSQPVPSPFRRAAIYAPQGRQAERASCSGAGQVRAGDQPQDCQGAASPAARRRGHRVAGPVRLPLHAVWVALHLPEVPISAAPMLPKLRPKACISPARFHTRFRGNEIPKQKPQRA